MSDALTERYREKAREMLWPLIEKHMIAPDCWRGLGDEHVQHNQDAFVASVAQALLDAHQKGIWVAVGEAMGYGLSESARAEILMGQGMQDYCPVEPPKGGAGGS